MGALEELSFLGVGFVSLNEGIDPQRPQDGSRWPTWARSRNSERERIAERVKAGLQRARAQGTKLGRRRERISTQLLTSVAGLSIRAAARVLRVPASRVHRERLRLQESSESASRTNGVNSR